MKYILILILILSEYSTDAQMARANNWVMGRGISYNYNFSNQQLNVIDTNFMFYFMNGTSCISDSNGKLRIICDGYDIMDSLGNYIENGDTIVPKLLMEKYNGSSGYCQSSIILPFEDDIYYVITPTASDYEVLTYWNDPNSGRALFDLLLYNKVDMSLNGGMGKVVKKAVPLLENVKLSKAQMMACRHSNGRDWWLLKQAHDTNMVYRFLVTKDSIYNYGVQGFAEPHFTKWDLAGQSMFSEQGDKYATLCSGRNLMFLADFNRCTGDLINGKVINLANHIKWPGNNDLDTISTGLCFSSNEKFLYLAKFYNIFQYEIDEPDSNLAWYHIANMDTTNAQFQGWGNAYMGNDGKMYFGNWNGLGHAMSYLTNPDAKGAACGFCPKCFTWPNWGAGNPPCMPNYALGKDTVNPCWPLLVEEAALVTGAVKAYPNPAQDMINIAYRFERGEERILQIYDLVGRKIWEQKLQASSATVPINCIDWVAGIYHFVIKSKTENYTGKIQIQR